MSPRKTRIITKRIGKPDFIENVWEIPESELDEEDWAQYQNLAYGVSPEEIEIGDSIEDDYSEDSEP